jgi:hypothetical protein
VHFEKSVGRVDVELSDLESLLDRDAVPVYPHVRPMLNPSVAEFMVDTAREDRLGTDLRVTLTFRKSRLAPEQETETRAKLASFFANEVAIAELERRVNRTEALGSLRFAIPVVIVAGVVAGLLAPPSVLGVPPYLANFAYLIALVVVWLMVWDPIEKLLFDSYFIRLRIRALHKLVSAKMVFAYEPGPAVAAGPAPVDPTPLESIRKTLEG